MDIKPINVKEEIAKIDKIIKKQNDFKSKKERDAVTGIIHCLLKLAVEQPDWRIGQMIANALREFDGRVNCDPFHISNEDLLEGLESLLDEFKQLDNYDKK